MNKYKALINIMPHKELLDPQGKTLTKNMKYLDLNHIMDIRVGKRIHMDLEALSENEAKSMVEKACNDLLANAIMESYDYTISELT